MMIKEKNIILAILFVFLSSAGRAEESEGLIQRAYRKFILKGKGVEKKVAPKSEDSGAMSGIIKEAMKMEVGGEIQKEMTKAEMIQEIRDEIEYNEDILEQIPDLKKQRDKDGKDVYRFLIEGKEVNLEDIDEKTVLTILEQVSAKANELRTDAIRQQEEQRKQLSSIKYPPQPPPSPPPPRPPAVTRPPRR